MAFAYAPYASAKHIHLHVEWHEINPPHLWRLRNLRLWSHKEHNAESWRAFKTEPIVLVAILWVPQLTVDLQTPTSRAAAACQHRGYLISARRVREWARAKFSPGAVLTAPTNCTWLSATMRAADFSAYSRSAEGQHGLFFIIYLFPYLAHSVSGSHFHQPTHGLVG